MREIGNGSLSDLLEGLGLCPEGIVLVVIHLPMQLRKDTGKTAVSKLGRSRGAVVNDAESRKARIKRRDLGPNDKATWVQHMLSAHARGSRYGAPDAAHEVPMISKWQIKDKDATA